MTEAEPVVVRQHDHLMGLGEVAEQLHQSVHLGGVHGLDRVVQHQETEGCLGHRGPREEQREGKRVQLALADDAEPLASVPSTDRIDPDAPLVAVPARVSAPSSTLLS